MLLAGIPGSGGGIDLALPCTPAQYLMAKDEWHGFRKKPNQEFQFYAALEFVKEFLLGN